MVPYERTRRLSDKSMGIVSHIGEDLDLPTPGETLESGVTKSLFATE
jgi:hypothetical protein